MGEMASFAKGNGYTKADLSTEGKPIILYGRLYTDYETVFSSIDTRSAKSQDRYYRKVGRSLYLHLEKQQMRLHVLQL